MKKDDKKIVFECSYHRFGYFYSIYEQIPEMLTISEDCRKRQALDYRRFFGYNFIGPRLTRFIYYISQKWCVWRIRYRI